MIKKEEFINQTIETKLKELLKQYDTTTPDFKFTLEDLKNKVVPELYIEYCKADVEYLLNNLVEIKPLETKPVKRIKYMWWTILE